VNVKRPNTGRIAEITKQAAEIAKGVPENLQEAAFNRAFEALSETGGAPTQRKRPEGNTQRRRARGRKPAITAKDDSANAADVLVTGLNRTAHPEITGASVNLDRALHILRVAERDFQIDGLTATQIAKVLTEKFRHSTSHQAIRQALNAAGNYVDYVPQASGGAIYRLMALGEKYLDAGGAAGTSDSKAERSRRTKPRRRTPSKPKPAKEPDGSSSRKRFAQGPKPMVEELIGEDFFASPKTISDIKNRLRDKKGVSFKAGDLSPTLVRLLRHKSLDRERNDSNQFEYSVPA
jgi:hypothetical protein